MVQETNGAVSRDPVESARGQTGAIQAPMFHEDDVKQGRALLDELARDGRALAAAMENDDFTSREMQCDRHFETYLKVAGAVPKNPYLAHELRDDETMRPLIAEAAATRGHEIAVVPPGADVYDTYKARDLVEGERALNSLRDASRHVQHEGRHGDDRDGRGADVDYDAYQRAVCAVAMEAERNPYLASVTRNVLEVQKERSRLREVEAQRIADAPSAPEIQGRIADLARGMAEKLPAGPGKERAAAIAETMERGRDSRREIAAGRDRE